MQIAAILTVAADTRRSGPSSGDSQASVADGRAFGSLIEIQVLGASVLERTVSKLTAAGCLPPTVLRDGTAAFEVRPAHPVRPSAFSKSWEKAVSHYLSEGVGLLFLVGIDAYIDLDYAELLRAHTESRSALTQAYGADGSLGVAIVDAELLRQVPGPKTRALSALIPQQKRFDYRGYINRLRSTHDLYRLMQDGLKRQCGLRPVGAEIQSEVWCGENALVDLSAVITGPAYIGANSLINASCKITGPSAVERNCQIDCGTLIESSLVLENTYIGAALDVHNAIASSGKLINFERNIEIRVSDGRLIGTAKTPLLAGLSSLLWSEPQVAKPGTFET